VSGVRYEFEYARWCGWLLGLLGMGRRFSAVIVDADVVTVRMGWAFRTEIPRASVAAVEPDDGMVLGWGVHGWRGRWLVNGSSRGLVRFAIAPPVRARVCGFPVRLTTLRVSLQDRDAALAALSSPR
jgi:hypothetical protein